MRRRWSVLLAALALTPLLGGCSSDDPAKPPATRPTPIAELEVPALRLARADFCDRVPSSAVRRALGGDSEGDQQWGNGDPVPGESGTGDIGHEIGCAWTGTGGAAARAWIFARSVTATLATSMVRDAGRQAGCTATTATVFGSPSLLQTCTSPGGLGRERRAGLFGDSWLTCEVSGPAQQLRARTDAWCAQVVASLDAG